MLIEAPSHGHLTYFKDSLVCRWFVYSLQHKHNAQGKQHFDLRACVKAILTLT